MSSCRVAAPGKRIGIVKRGKSGAKWIVLITKSRVSRLVRRATWRSRKKSDQPPAAPTTLMVADGCGGHRGYPLPAPFPDWKKRLDDLPDFIQHR
jgi:hypothetical protein